MLHPGVLGEAGGDDHVLILHHSGRGHGERLGQLEDDVRLGNRPTLDELPGRGHVLGSPWGAPASTQATSVSMSLWDNEASFENFPNCGSANHGGIFFCSTADLMAFAHGRACS